MFAQSYRQLEVIVVDDGSEDDTWAVAKTYGDRIRLARQARGGAGAARNVAVGLATGTYLAFLDADDRFTPTKLEHQLAALDADLALDVVFGHVREFVSPELPPEARARIRPPAPPSPRPMRSATPRMRCLSWSVSAALSCPPGVRTQSRSTST